jgi:hypothetical protein
MGAKLDAAICLIGHVGAILPRQNARPAQHNRPARNILGAALIHRICRGDFLDVVGIARRASHKARTRRRDQQHRGSSSDRKMGQRKIKMGRDTPVFSSLCFLERHTMIHNMEAMRGHDAPLASWVGSPLWNRSTRSRDFNPRLVN